MKKIPFYPRKVSLYVAKLFLTRLACLTLFLICFVFLFEILEIIKSADKDLTFFKQIYIASLKIPFVLHQILPFLFFGTTLLLLWRLNRYQEITALKASGFSFWQIFFPLLFIATSLSFTDLYFLHPVSQELLKKQKLFYKINSFNKSQVSIWKSKFMDDKKFIFYFKQLNNTRAAGVDIYIFSKEGAFLQRYYSQKVILRPKRLLLYNVWEISSEKSPHFLRTHILSLPFDIFKLINTKAPEDPREKTFKQLQKDFKKKIEKTTASRIRWHYLLSHTFWLIALIPLGLAFGLSPGKGLSALLWKIGGVLTCFLLFVFKEFLYVFHWSQPESSLSLLLWAPTFFTCFLALTLLLEKNEL